MHLYLISKLGNSGVHIFKRYTIWSWNEEVMAVWRWLCIPWTEMLHFATVGQIFEVLPGSQIMYTISHFEAWEVRSPVLQMVHDLDLKLRSYSHLKTNRTKPMRKFFWFRSCAPISKGVLQLRNHPLAHECHFAAPVRPFHSCKMGCENSHPPRNPPPATKMLQA